MPEPVVPSPDAQALPLVASLCGTWLKPEMQSIYRQVTGLRRYRTVVFTENVQHAGAFPFEPVVTMARQARPRPKGNFVLRFWYKHLLKKWPPPREICRIPGGAWFPYNLPALLDGHRPALAHVYYGHKAVKYLPMLEAWGGPFLVSFHGVDVVKFTEDPAYVEGLQRVFARAELILARSRSLLDGLRALGCAGDKLRLNRTPVPVDRFPATVREGPADGEWRLIQACRLIPKKGLFTTLEALRQVVPDFPRLRFLVCGSGPEKDGFLARRDELGLRDCVQVAGWLSQDRLIDEYRKAHLFLHPSELTGTSDQEGIPNSMLEAMATGLPVVATRHGGIPEAVTDGVDGLLVAERSPDELAAALRRFLENPATVAEFSRNAAANVRASFSLEASVGKLEDSYDEAIAAFRRTPK